MVFLGVVGFVEDEEVYLADLDVGAEQALVQDLCRTDNHHVLFEVPVPCLFVP